ncbi:MAG TPA: ATP-binding protein [Blastocatellia bacterium]|nr:ATP-binding protein [Blastocatellia bacterium]
MIPKLRQLKLKPIPTLLGLCFFLLLVLILISGFLGQNRLEEISIKSDESARAYLARLNLAFNIREAASDTVGQARLYRASKDLGIRGPVYRINLNKAKNELLKLFEKGKQVWPAHQATLPVAEIDAWRKMASAIQGFCEVIEKEEQERRPSIAPTTPVLVPNLAADSSSAPSPDQDLGDEFFQRRTNLESSTDHLAKVINEGLGTSQEDVKQLKNRAVFVFGSANWTTLGMGIIVIGFTIFLTRSYISEAKKEERLKQEAQGRLRSVFDSLSDDIIVLSEKGEVLEVNRAFLRHFSFSDAELKLQDYQAVLAQIPEVASFVGQTLQHQDFDQHQRERIEVKSTNGHPDSSLFDVSVSALKVGNDTHGRVIVMDDVTEDERVREELRRSRTLSAVGQITAQVAHEIYNPLGAVKLNLELLEVQVRGDEDVKHTIARLKRGVEHLSTIIMDLRYLTRPRDPERKPTDLNKLLDEVLELASDRLERSRISIVRDFSIEAAQGKYDPQQLRKVFLNLLINAVEASPQNGEVQLRTRFIPGTSAEIEPDQCLDFNSSNGAIAVSVIDHGVGMSTETKKRIFEAFYTTKRNGTGLGMMITQEIVKKHGGKIEVESEEGKGTTVNVYLPA